MLILGLAIGTAIGQSVPALGMLDGYWMLAGAAAATGAIAPIAWRWPRERALMAVAVTSLAGAWLPLIGLALRAGIPVSARLKGAMFFSSADVIGITLLWLACQEHHGASPIRSITEPQETP
jgi:hypothetical protein